MFKEISWYVHIYIILHYIIFLKPYYTGEPLNCLPLTQYKSNSNDYCGNADEHYDCFYIPLYGNDVLPIATQLKASLEVLFNPEICVPLSNCKDDFSQACSFATNCVYNATDSHLYAFANLAINTNKCCPDISKCSLYARLIGKPNTCDFTPGGYFLSSRILKGLKSVFQWGYLLE